MASSRSYALDEILGTSAQTQGMQRHGMLSGSQRDTGDFGGEAMSLGPSDSAFRKSAIGNLLSSAAPFDAESQNKERIAWNRANPTKKPMDLLIYTPTRINVHSHFDYSPIDPSPPNDSERFFIISFHGAFSDSGSDPYRSGCKGRFNREQYHLMNDNVYYMTSSDPRVSVVSLQEPEEQFLKSYFDGDNSSSGTRNGVTRLKQLFSNPEILEQFYEQYASKVGDSRYQSCVHPDGTLRSICHYHIARRKIHNDMIFFLTEPATYLKGIYEIRNGHKMKLLLDSYNDDEPYAGSIKSGSDPRFHRLIEYVEHGTRYRKKLLCLSDIIAVLKQIYPGKKLYIYLRACSTDSNLRHESTDIPEPGSVTTRGKSLGEWCSDCLTGLITRPTRQPPQRDPNERQYISAPQNMERNTPAGGKTNKLFGGFKYYNLNNIKLVGGSSKYMY